MLMKKELKPRHYWTFDRCKEDALKYNSLIEWRKKSNSSYLISGRNNWKKNISSHMKRPKNHNFKWSLENCILDAKKHKTKQSWRESKNSGYTVAKRNKWLDLCCRHMESYGGTSKKEIDIFEIVNNKISSIRGKRFRVTNEIYKAKCFELDIYIPELNKGIEFDGKYWHSLSSLQKRFPNWSLTDVSRYHELKDGFFQSIGIEVVHVKEEDWLKNKQLEVTKILNFIGARING